MPTSELIEALGELIPDDENEAYCVVSAKLMREVVARLRALEVELDYAASLVYPDEN